MKNSTAPEVVARTQMTLPAAKTVPTSGLFDCAATRDANIMRKGTATALNVLRRTPMLATELQTERRCMARSTAHLRPEPGRPSRARIARAAPRQKTIRVERVSPFWREKACGESFVDNFVNDR